MLWDRICAAGTGRPSWLLAVALFLIGSGVVVSVGTNTAAGQAPQTLPPGSAAARAEVLAQQFPGSDQAALIVVVSRIDGAVLDSADVAAAAQARDRMQAAIRPVSTANDPPPEVSADGKVALTVVPISARLSGLSLDRTVRTVRGAAGTGLPSGLQVHVTGGPAFGADIANAFSGANVTLLVVTASVVALLLIATYRSPVLWLVPLIAIGFADQVANSVGTAVAGLTGLSFDGATSGITGVLVFGAGTNYALLLISRYRQELRRHSAHRDALQRAIRGAGPAIVASNATVVLALLTLILAVVPSTRSLGVLAACGLVVAAVSVLALLPPLLALCGRRVFWPFIPHPDDDGVDTGPWRWVADWVARRPAAIGAVAIAVLTALAAGLLGTRIGLSQTEQFRVRADSVSGFEILADHFPAGLASPTTVIASSAHAAQVESAIKATGGVVSANESGRSPSGLTKWTVVTNAAPSTHAAFETVAALGGSVSKADPTAVVGGADAQALDVRNGATRDRRALIPAILAVILAVLYVLLRSALAPPTLLAATILGALAALGSGGWASLHVFGFAGLDDSTPLFAFLFLAALGVDYTIFLVTRTREEAALHNARGGMVRAVSATGGVITSAGIVLAAVFCVLGVLPLIVLTQLGIIVGLGILLDTFIVRTLVIPALFALIGDRIWWPTKVGAGAVRKPKYEGKHRE